MTYVRQWLILWTIVPLNDNPSGGVNIRLTGLPPEARHRSLVST